MWSLLCLLMSRCSSLIKKYRRKQKKNKLHCCRSIQSSEWFSVVYAKSW
jgi:hypothetical protein